MHAISPLDIEAELSYAYLHAVASAAGVSCRNATRLEDSSGIDAMLTSWGPFETSAYLREVDLKIQLKATIKSPRVDEKHLSYYLKGIERYNDLRQPAVAVPRILVVLFLPEDKTQWLEAGEEALILRKCAYWASLRTAPETSNTSGVTIRLPKAQIFDQQNLQGLMRRLSLRQFPTYEDAP